MIARPFVSTASSRASFAPGVLMGVPKLQMPHFVLQLWQAVTSAQFWQIVSAIFVATNAAILTVIGTLNLHKIVPWFKSKVYLGNAIEAAEQRAREAKEAGDIAHRSVQDLSESIKVLRSENLRMQRRLDQLEERTDAAFGWIPRVLEYIAWLEHVAKAAALDLGARAMPPLPAILVDYFNRKGIDP